MQPVLLLLYWCYLVCFKFYIILVQFRLIQNLCVRNLNSGWIGDYLWLCLTSCSLRKSFKCWNSISVIVVPTKTASHHHSNKEQQQIQNISFVNHLLRLKVFFFGACVTGGSNKGTSRFIELYGRDGWGLKFSSC